MAGSSNGGVKCCNGSGFVVLTDGRPALKQSVKKLTMFHIGCVETKRVNVKLLYNSLIPDDIFFSVDKIHTS